MKHIFISFLFVFIISGISAKEIQQKDKKVTVEISFGESKPVKTVTIDCQKKLTALEALQLAADVETHPVGNHVFVIAIDDVVSTRGEMAWYYRINGEEPVKLAINQSVKAGDTISWRYVKDVCSATVDGEEK